MVKYGILFAFLFVGGLAYPASEDDGPGFDEDMSIFFDHTVSDIEGRIVGGNQAADGAFPWMIAMINGAGQSFLCGGSILNNRRVLTAAHCIAAAVSGGQLSRTLRIRAGTNRWNSGGQTHNTQGFRNHPNYNPNTLKNDIGVLIIASAITMNNRVRIMPIAWDHIGANLPCRVAGWGRTSTGGPLSANLMVLQTGTIDGQRCISEVQRVSRQLNMRVPHVDPAVEICTFLAVNRGACNGDSGSPLIRNSNNQQIGIVSWGLPCARGAPDMFVRVSVYRAFINSV